MRRAVHPVLSLLIGVVLLPSCFGGAYGSGLPQTPEERRLWADRLTGALEGITLLIPEENQNDIQPYLELVQPIATALLVGNEGFDYEAAIAELQKAEPQVRAILDAEGVDYQTQRFVLWAWNEFLRELAHAARVSKARASAEVELLPVGVPGETETIPPPEEPDQ